MRTRPRGPALLASVLVAAAAPAGPAAPRAAAAQPERDTATPLGAPRGRATAEVPFEYDDARVWVPVRVAGGPVRWFILDTGASTTVVDAGVACQSGAAVADAGTAGGAGANRARQGRASVGPLDVGGVRLAAPDVTVLPLDSLLAPYAGRPAPGIVGSQFFAEHVVELDFTRRRLRLYDPAGYRAPSAATAIPIRLVGGVPMADGAVTLPGAEAVPVRLLVDLGAKATLLVAEPFMARHDLTRALAGSVLAPLGAGVGGETRYRFARLPRLTLGAGGGGAAVAADGVVAGLSAGGTLRPTWYDALLGVEFLARYRVTSDYAHGRLLLEPRAAPAPPAEFDMSGMYLVAGRAPRRVVVHAVVPGGPADAAGVRAGDQVVAVDGRPADDYGLGALRDLLRSAEGRAVRLEVERAGARSAATLRLRRLI